MSEGRSYTHTHTHIHRGNLTAKIQCWFNLMNAAALFSYFSLLIGVSLHFCMRDDVDCVHNKLPISFKGVISHWVE